MEQFSFFRLAVQKWFSLGAEQRELCQTLPECTSHDDCWSCLCHFFYIILFSLSTFWGKLEINAGIEIPKYVDTVTPQYKPKFDAVVSSCCSHTFVFLSLLPENLFCFLCFLSGVALPTFPTWVHPIFFSSCINSSLLMCFFLVLIFMLPVDCWIKGGWERASEGVRKDREGTCWNGGNEGRG